MRVQGNVMTSTAVNFNIINYNSASYPYVFTKF